MTKLLLALGVAAVAFTATPSAARHYTNYTTCVNHRHGHCVAWRELTRAEARHRGLPVGHVFGPDYAYADVASLPGTVVTRYHLGPNFRYVHENGFVYVVNPRTYRVVRVIPVS